MKTAKKVLKYMVGTVLLLVVLGITTVAVLLEPAIKIRGLQNLDINKLSSVTRTVTVLDDADNELADTLYGNDRIFTPIGSLTRATLDAFISVEDKRFYTHSGIDYIRLLAAVKNDIASCSFKEGASTISQQLVKNTHLSNEKSLSRKLQEMRIARALERKFSKDEILEMYLNILYFGNNLYGIGSAADAMFGKSAADLTVPESALLAGIINNPARFSPYRNPEQAHVRRDLVLGRMLENGKLSKSDYSVAINTKIITMPVIAHKNAYIDGVLAQAAKALRCSEEDLYRKNITIGTNLDQNFKTVTDLVLQKAELNDTLTAQILIMDNGSGKILAVSGHNADNLDSLRRQPGSTVKPIIAYAPAIEKRIAFPSTPILDEPTDFSGYAPSNYRNKFEGWTTVENALIRSSNVCAAKLLEASGIEYAKTIARRCGYNFTKNDNSLSLALGGMDQGLTLRQLANSFQTLANDGNMIESSYIRYIKDSDGNLIYEQKAKENRVMSDIVPYFINNMLKKCAERGTAKCLNGAARNLCAKTGTVGDETGNTDAYCIAYTPEYTVAVWVGAKDNAVPHKITGGGVPTDLAREVFLKLPPNSNDFNRPKSIRSVELDARELAEKHRLVLADDELLPRYRKTAEFPVSKIPRKKTPSVSSLPVKIPAFIPKSDIATPTAPKPLKPPRLFISTDSDQPKRKEPTDIGAVDPGNYTILNNIAA